MGCKALITVIDGRNNPSTLVFGEHEPPGAPTILDFNLGGDVVTRILLKLEQDDVLITSVDSDAYPLAFDWTGNDGEVIFDLGGVGLVVGDYDVKMFIYSPTRPLGEFLQPDDQLYTFFMEVISV